MAVTRPASSALTLLARRPTTFVLVKRCQYLYFCTSKAVRRATCLCPHPPRPPPHCPWRCRSPLAWRWRRPMCVCVCVCVCGGGGGDMYMCNVYYICIYVNSIYAYIGILRFKTLLRLTSCSGARIAAASSARIAAISSCVSICTFVPVKLIN